MATVQKRNNSYKITASCGYDINGKQIRKSITWVPEQNMTQKQISKELERQKVMLEEKCKTGSMLDENIKFLSFIDVWEKDYASVHLAPKTHERYQSLLKRIIPHLGHMRIGKIQPQHILSLYNKLSNDVYTVRKCTATDEFITHLKNFTVSELARITNIAPSTIRDIKNKKVTSEALLNKASIALMYDADSCSYTEIEKRLAERTVLHHHRLLSSIFSMAVQWQVIKENPCTRVKAPKVSQKEINYLDDKQVKYLIELLDEAPIQYKTMIITLIYTGMRLGELCGLEWKDVDFDNEIITIKRTSQYTKEKGIFTKEPKTQTSIRTNKYPSVLFRLLKSYRAYQNEERLRLGDKWQDTDRLFTKWDGSPIYPNTLNKWLTRFIKDKDLPRITVHSLRHTNATLLISGGVDIRTVSKRLGHSQTSTTLNIYTHAIASADEKASETLQDILNPTSKKAQ